MIGYDITAWLYCIDEYTAATYYLWFGMIAQCDRAEDLWICCIAEYMATITYMYDSTMQ